MDSFDTKSSPKASTKHDVILFTGHSFIRHPSHPSRDLSPFSKLVSIFCFVRAVCFLCPSLELFFSAR
ncbi:hypothetical protein EUGRSUZ_D01993 [Eucalyptus grandis]|uniref:Uncharacterized protein n=2 Tax=Eucalyptus grandis TaxID=71139 RepID=A0ACC3L6E5_EUCGR|nr:hypothetical protein EUGRSUZ_D01993 [Eucalyptus grandis]